MLGSMKKLLGILVPSLKTFNISLSWW